MKIDKVPEIISIFRKPQLFKTPNTMKFRLLFLTLLISTLSAISQTNFESGYIIQTNGNKVNCLIKNEDWKGSPTTFMYKLNENAETKIGSTANVIEFGSAQSFKYVKATVEIDQSSDNVNNLSEERAPILKEETLFLKTLVEGKASLYFTQKDFTDRYFYRLNDGEIEQLIYKRFFVNSSKIGKNERYKQQLATTLSCSAVNERTFEDLQYKTNSLMNLINKYNTCENSESVVFKKNSQKGKFNLSIRPGVTFTSFSLQRKGDDKVDFDNNTGIRIGLEAEYILPFNNGKWSIFAEPTYRNYKTEKEIVYVEMLTFQKVTLVTVDYNSIEFPVGGRHYMFLNQNSAFFVDAAVIMDISTLDSKITSSDENSYDLDISADVALGLGVGFRYKNKYSLEARYHTGRKLLNYQNINSEYNSFALIAGYNFL